MHMCVLFDTLVPVQMLTYGRRMTPAEVLCRIDAVDAAAVRTAAQSVIHDKDVAVAGVGHVHELPDINWFRRRTFRLRV
jgi:mitochondrial-processing peptidase subunit beta